MFRPHVVATVLIGLLATSGPSRAQNYADLPAQVVRDALAAADCPQTEVTTFGVRPATATHRDCFYLALETIGCRRGNVDLCFQSLWGEVPPRRDPGAPRPLAEPRYWTDDRVARLFAGYLPGTPAPQTVRATPQVVNAHIEANRPPPPPPESGEALAKIMVPFEHDPQPLVGSLVFAETYGMELVPQETGGWRIGRIALGSAAWGRDEFQTGMRVPEVAIQKKDGPRDYSAFPKCEDDACLDAMIPSLVEGDFIRIDGRPMDQSMPPAPGAPWIRLYPHVPKRMLDDRFRAQLALARSGLILENQTRVKVVHVEPGSPAEKLGLQIGDQMRSIDRGGISGTGYVNSVLGKEGPVEIAFIRDGAPQGATLERRSGDVVFRDGIATIESSIVAGVAPDPITTPDQTSDAPETMSALTDVENSAIGAPYQVIDPAQVRSVLHGDPAREADTPRWAHFMRACTSDRVVRERLGGGGAIVTDQSVATTCACREVVANQTLTAQEYAVFLRPGLMWAANFDFSHDHDGYHYAFYDHCFDGVLSPDVTARLAAWASIGGTGAGPDMRDPYGTSAEPAIAARARAAGLVYRNRAFWGEGPYARDLRAVFEGDAPMLDPVTVARILRGFAPAYAAACADEPSRTLDWPEAAQLSQVPAVEAMLPQLSRSTQVPGILSAAFIEVTEQTFITEERLHIARDLVASQRRSEADVTAQLVGRELAAMELGRRIGCATPTAQQFMQNLAALWFGRPSLHESSQRIAGAMEDSDAAPF